MNSNLLKGEIISRAMTQDDVAKAIGISLSRFNAKLNNSGGAEFRLGEVNALKKLLGLTPTQIDNIFFEDKVS